MNILLFSRAAWDDTNSVGNTFSNFFNGWDEDRFSHFYIRKQIPHNRCVNLYYNVSALDVVKKLLGKHILPAKFRMDELPSRITTIVQAHDKEQRNIDRIHKRKNPLIYWAVEQVWRSRLWQNADFREFVIEADPDVFFAFATNSFILWPLIRYLKANTKARIVLFIADDVYNNIGKQAFYRKYYLRTSYRKCIENADAIYAISPALCEAYGNIFGRDIKLLMKGCEFSKPVSDTVNATRRIVYAGNLFYGRAQILAKIADVLEELSCDKISAQLEIYTTATITEELNNLLNKGTVSRIMGSRPYEEIKEIMNKADIVLHVESFEPSQMDCVRYSLSTKIIDCLQSGSAVVGIGPVGISSIDYLRGIKGVEIVDDLSRLEYVLKELLTNSDRIIGNAGKIREYAECHHDIRSLHCALRKDFLELTRHNAGGIS